MERNIKAYTSIVLGILFCGSVLIGYIPIPEYAIELTCISNSFIGILLLLTGINVLRKMLLTPIPVMTYLFFDYIVGICRGTFVYGIFEADETGFTAIFLIMCGVYISLLMIAAVTQYINQKIRKIIFVRH